MEILIDFHTNRQVKYDTDPNHTYNELLTQAIDVAIQALGDGSIRNTLIDYTDQLKAYTHESMTILGHDERESSEFVDIFLSTPKQNQP